jgi:hypothetical protein
VLSRAVCVQPALACPAYSAIAFVPSLAFVLAAKVTEKSMDHSLNNTVRNMLFLPCTREEKYSAKQVIDSLFARLGDVISAGLVFVGTAMFSLGGLCPGEHPSCAHGTWGCRVRRATLRAVVVSPDGGGASCGEAAGCLELTF